MGDIAEPISRRALDEALASNVARHMIPQEAYIRLGEVL